MSAKADMSASSFGASLDVARPSAVTVALGGRHGSCLCCVIMSGGAGHRLGWLPVFLLAAFCVLAPGSGAAWPATGGGHGGGHVGGSFRRGREGGRFGGRPVPRVHRGPGVFIFPYYGYDPYYPDYPYAAYCDEYSPYYTPQYCYWDDGP
jgi:hypothetical protein